MTDAIMAAADRAARAIPPAWPLAATVAVNPFLGQTDRTLAQTGALMSRVAGAPVTMPRAWYAARIADGAIAASDLARAADAAGLTERDLRDAATRPHPVPPALPTVAELAAAASGTDWPGLVADRIGAWAGGFFDEGQALWAAPRGRGAWDAWRRNATHDLTPEVAGLRGFAQFALDTHRNPAKVIARAVDTLGVRDDAREVYFHRLLLTMGGWAQAARYRLWQAELRNGTDATLLDLLAIRLVWEEALHGQHADAIADAWAAAKDAYAAPLDPDRDAGIDAALQHAAECAAQRDLAATLAAPGPAPRGGRPALQAAFCIDVRSEVFRRALEAVDPAIRTLGFAGFFGLRAAHRAFASDVEEMRLPVLLTPAVHSVAGDGTDDAAQADRTARFHARARRAWGRFKLAAVSSFAFVEAMGPVYAAKLVRDALGLPGRRPAAPEPAPRLDPALSLPDRIDAAETVLRAMSLTDDFARLVLIAGHGANVTNDPYASALHCGACGGYSGEVNARLLAALLNDADVRAGVAERGIAIPRDTLFLGALHDTTTDAVAIYDADHPSPDHAADLDRARDWLARAGAMTRAERATRLPRADADGIAARSRDWAEVRPEWALAGCKAFVAAPRSRTAGRSLEGRAFLHDYDWRRDEGFGVLELIMTAPVVVASWISLQYYGSTVAPKLWGSGDKLLHNVVGGIGVLEGNGGTLRAGLSWQSVHDGTDYVHDPLRLSVCIEAPREAMTDVLRRHDGVRALFDNRWLHLFALDEAGRMAWRYAGGLDWEAMGDDVTLARAG
ncbi:DUF2309 domain-containing protein [Jannaschia sp. LMIT008]|uniref:YbcC family protein n=1 Tax=Jannaschia maritima TaxID=3032585 RepID=UPI002811095F|nr:DUF2309 domain-containing protein [Jannaschia sp. LMIT008]